MSDPNWPNDGSVPPPPGAVPQPPQPSPFEPPPAPGGYAAPAQPPYQPPYQPPPQPGYQPPAQGAYQQPVPPPPAQVQKKRRWPWIVLAVVVFMGGCTALLYRAVSGPIDTSNEFLGLVQDRDYSGAAQMLDSSCFDDGGTAGALQSIFDDGIESYRLSGTSTNSTNGTTTGGANGTITFTGDDERTIDFRLTKPDDWKICGFNIGARGN